MPRTSDKTRRFIDTKDYLRQIIDSANEGIYVTDMERRFLIWNRKAEQITGYRREEVIGRFCHDDILCHADAGGALLCEGRCPLFKSMDLGLTSGPHVLTLRHKEGRRVSVEVTTAPLRDNAGNVIGGVETFRDVTERISRDTALAEKKRKLEVVLNNIGDGILFIDSNGCINMYNRALSEMFRVKEDLVGSHIYSLPREGSLRRAISRLDTQFQGPYCWERNGCTDTADCPERGASYCRCWISGSRRAASCRQVKSCCECPQYREVKSFLERPRELTLGKSAVSALSSFIEFSGKNEIWEVIVFKDVTIEKLDAAVKLANTAAHELRQPLQIIVGAVSLLRDEFPGEGRQGEYMDALDECCYRMDRIIKQINNITRYRVKEYTSDIRILDIDVDVASGDTKQ